ncbi:interferon-inducible protein AIM2-like [Mustelus asterias]
MSNIRAKLLRIVEELSDEEYENLKFFLEDEDKKIKIPRGILKDISKPNLVNTLINYYTSQGATKVLEKVLSKVPRNDLLPIKIGPLTRKISQDRPTKLQENQSARKQKIDSTPKFPGSRITTLRELKELELNDMSYQKDLTVRGKILEKVNHNYINNQAKKMKVFHATIADENDTIQVKVYNREHGEFRKGANIQITNFKYSNGVINVTRNSQINKLASKVIKTTKEVPVLSLREIKQKPEGTFVNGCFEITTFSQPIKGKDKSPLRITITDGSDQINVIIFKPPKILSCEIGKYLKMLGIKVNVYKKEIQLRHQCDSYVKVQ